MSLLCVKSAHQKVSRRQRMFWPLVVVHTTPRHVFTMHTPALLTPLLRSTYALVLLHTRTRLAEHSVRRRGVSSVSHTHLAATCNKTQSTPTAIKCAQLWLWPVGSRAQRGAPAAVAGRLRRFTGGVRLTHSLAAYTHSLHIQQTTNPLRNPLIQCPLPKIHCRACSSRFLRSRWLLLSALPACPRRPSPCG
jgi:hypothetical protein